MTSVTVAGAADRSLVMNDTQQDKVFATLAGGALGDAFGYRIEFQSLNAIRASFGRTGMLEPVYDRHGRLVVSDDTQMTLFTAEGIMEAFEGTEDPFIEGVNTAIREAYLRWYATQADESRPAKNSRGLSAFPEMHVRRAPSKTCLSALAAGGHGTTAFPINASNSCGGVTRVAPLGLVPSWSAQRAMDAGTLAAALTHGHPSAYWSAGVLAGLIREALDGNKLHAATRKILRRLEGHSEAEEVIDAAHKALSYLYEERSPDVMEQKLGIGRTAEEALSIGIYACLKATRFEEALRIAVNHSGNSDATASIAGQIWGAFHGSSEMPEIWINALDILKPLQLCTKQMLSVRNWS